MLKFIPVRGREHVALEFRIVSHIVEIYPREGAETPQLHARHTGYQLKFIPVRGRKQRVAVCVLHFRRVEFIPVRGRKPCDAST